MVALAVCAMTFLSGGTAMADSINGIWCGQDGQRTEISYEEVKLSDGTEVYGDYDRHHYVFKMPPHGEWAGATVDLVLGSEDVVFARYISESGEELLSEPEKWTRCQSTVS